MIEAFNYDVVCYYYIQQNSFSDLLAASTLVTDLRPVPVSPAAGAGGGAHAGAGAAGGGKCGKFMQIQSQWYS